MARQHQQILDAFGDNLIREVRDQTCKFLQAVIAGKVRGDRSQELYHKYTTLTPENAAVVHEFLVEAVDDCLHAFLQFLEAHEIGVIVRDDNGKPVDIRDLSDGLSGELYSDDGWINKFSQFGDQIQPES